MFKHYFEGIQYIEIGPIVGLVVFMVFFIVLVYLVLKLDKGFVNEMKNKPLEGDHEPSQPNLKDELT